MKWQDIWFIAWAAVVLAASSRGISGWTGGPAVSRNG